MADIRTALKYRNGLDDYAALAKGYVPVRDAKGRVPEDGEVVWLMEQGGATDDQCNAAQAVVVAEQLKGKEGNGVHIMQFYQQRNKIMWATQIRRLRTN